MGPLINCWIRSYLIGPETPWRRRKPFPPACHAGEIYVPYGWKVSALRAEKSKANFSFREANFSFRDRTVVWPSVARLDSPDRGKESSPRGMESFLRFFLSKTTHFSAIGMHFFFLWPLDTTIRSQNGHLWMPPVQTSFMDSPWSQITTFMHACALFRGLQVTQSYIIYGLPLDQTSFMDAP